MSAFFLSQQTRGSEDSRFSLAKAKSVSRSQEVKPLILKSFSYRLKPHQKQRNEGYVMSTGFERTLSMQTPAGGRMGAGPAERTPVGTKCKNRNIK